MRRTATLWLSFGENEKVFFCAQFITKLRLDTLQLLFNASSLVHTPAGAAQRPHLFL